MSGKINKVIEAMRIEHDSEFHGLVHKMGDFIKSLHLNPPDHDRLIALITELIETCEKKAFFTGAEAVTKLALSGSNKGWHNGFIQ